MIYYDGGTCTVTLPYKVGRFFNFVGLSGIRRSRKVFYMDT
jgi:hypothetical protein